MTVVATDDFNRANGALGANWTAVATETMPNIATNQAIATTTGIDYGGKYTAASTGAADHYAQADVITNVSSANQECGVFVRAPSGTTANFYLGHSPAYTVGTHRLYKVTGGTFTQIAVTGSNPLATGTRTVKVDAVGTAITLYENGVSKVTTTDATYSGATNQFTGFHLYWDTSGTSNNVVLDNFELGTVSASSAPSQVTGLIVYPMPQSTAMGLTWDIPSDGGSPLTDYLIERAPDSAGAPGTFAAVTHTATPYSSFINTGLTANTKYWFRISAVNAVGTGTASANGTATTLASSQVAAIYSSRAAYNGMGLRN